MYASHVWGGGGGVWGVNVRNKRVGRGGGWPGGGVGNGPVRGINRGWGQNRVGTRATAQQTPNVCVACVRNKTNV